MKEDNRNRTDIQPPSLILPTVNPSLTIDDFEEGDLAFEQWENLYDTFHASNYEEKVTLVRTAIRKAVLDEELVFEFFNELYSSMVARGHLQAFMDLVTLLKSNQGVEYVAEKHWFFFWEIPVAFALEDTEALEEVTEHLIRSNHDGTDLFYPVFNLLLYHDCRDILLKAISKYRPDIHPKENWEYSKSSINQQLADIIVLNYIQEQAKDDLLDARHIARLFIAIEPYMVEAPDRDGLIEFISWAGGLTNGQWLIGDFVLQSKGRGLWDKDVAQDPAIANLRDLSSAFLHYAYRVEKIPLLKADLARDHLMAYIIERQLGELDDNGYSRNSKHRSRPSKVRNRKKTGVLLPDYDTLMQYLPRFYGSMGDGVYAGAALLELIPAWVRFLQSKDLATEDEGLSALRDRERLSKLLLQTETEALMLDPVLLANLQK